MRKGTLSLTSKLRKILEKKLNTKEGEKLMADLLMEAMVKHSSKGNAAMMKEILERIDGKIVQKIEQDLTLKMYDKEAPTNDV